MVFSPCSFSSFSFSRSRSVPEKSPLGWWLHQLLCARHLTSHLGRGRSLLCAKVAVGIGRIGIFTIYITFCHLSPTRKAIYSFRLYSMVGTSSALKVLSMAFLELATRGKMTWPITFFFKSASSLIRVVHKICVLVLIQITICMQAFYVTS